MSTNKSMASGPLSNLKLKINYSSDVDDLVANFYSPCMRASVLYQRAVGYFTSQGLAYAAKGVANLLANGGRIQLIASPVLDEADSKAINEGYESRKESIISVVRRSFAEVSSRLERERLSALAWLVEEGALDVRLALRVDQERKLCSGLYHEKMGIFSDEFGNRVAFSGSANETVGGLIQNFESIDVYWSWDDPAQRVAHKAKRFEALWENSTPGLEILEFTSVTEELLNKYRTQKRPGSEIDFSESDGIKTLEGPRLPSSIQLREYQREAIRSWFKNNGKGIFKMATGSGKTVTALSTVTELFKKGGVQALIIVCPFKHLVLQWDVECRKFELEPILALDSRAKWEPLLTGSLYRLGSETVPFVCVIATNATFGGGAFQAHIKHFPPKTVFIADEVHNLGADNLSRSLPEFIPFRLGLSATPERWMDEAGTERIFEYFDGVLTPEFTLADAVRAGVLARYRYYPLLIELSPDEREKFLLLSARIAKAFASGGSLEDDSPVGALLVERARLVGSASGKLDALRALIQEREDWSHMLVYCGDGSVEDPISTTEMRQIDVVTRILGAELGLRVAQYTATTPLSERSRLADDLVSGDLQGLVAIRCLDEGVDIPSVQTAIILASSRNPRQFIQRRGRILRQAIGKDAAEIYDMIVVPPKEARLLESERTLLRGELERFAEFADLALNAGDARRRLLTLQKEFDLMDI